MNIFKHGWIVIMILLTQQLKAQNIKQSIHLGRAEDFLTQFKNNVLSSKLRGGKTVISLQTMDENPVDIELNVDRSSADEIHVIGNIKDKPLSTFFLDATSTFLKGYLILRDKNKAFEYYIDESDNAFIKEVDISTVLCIDYLKSKTKSSNQKLADVQSTPLLQSLPNAGSCALLDFDGEHVENTLWLNGAAIDAQPSALTETEITQVWQLVSEDYKPFDVNITTDVNVFNSYASNKRMRVVFTPTNTAAPGAGGVAYVNSYGRTDNTPCWVFNLFVKGAAEAASHELGHTFGLSHDGRFSPSEEYFSGVASSNWAPIMGSGYNKTLVQFSKGEYNSANNLQDDIAIITSHIGFKGDDYGNTVGTAALLAVDANGVVSGTGIIEQATDKDFFFFTTTGGKVVLNIQPAINGDLDILAKLYDPSGELYSDDNPGMDNNSSTLSMVVPAGTYYLSVDGVGYGDPATGGYSDYGSLGAYTISGTIPKALTGLRIPENPSSVLSGLDYKYCEGNWYMLPDFIHIAPVKTGVSDGPDLNPRARDNQYALSFTGFIDVPTDGTYTFYTSSDDGSELLIGNYLVVSNDGVHSLQEASGNIGLKAGKHAISMNYFQQTSSQTFQVAYSGPAISKQFIPNTVFYRIPNVIPQAFLFGGCNYDTISHAELAPGDYTTAQLQAKGMLSDQLSSLKVNNGYEVVLYDLDNFQGVYTSPINTNVSCLSDLSFDNITSAVKVRVPIINNPPSVVVTSPANNTQYNTPTSITINASASDNDGQVSKVDFYNGTQFLGSDLTAPYSLVWSNVSVGTYLITAKATDNLGKSTLATYVSVRVHASPPPTVSITFPANNMIYSAPAGVTINAVANDESAVSKVDFYNGSIFIGSDATSPYSFLWSNISAGTYTITAKATDNTNETTISAPITLTVNSVTGNVATFYRDCDYNLSGYAIGLPVGDYTTSLLASYGIANNDISSLKVNTYFEVVLYDLDNFQGSSQTYNANNSCLGSLNDWASSLKVRATPNQAPSATITSPANNSTYIAPANITINAIASDGDGTITRVDFYNGNSFLGSDNTSPYSFSWTSVSQGTYSVTARSVDNRGAITTSAVLTVIVNSFQDNIPAEKHTMNDQLFNIIPNPFVGNATIDVEISNAGETSLKIFDKLGKPVVVLFEGYLKEGLHSFEWDGSALVPDVYIMRCESKNQIVIRRIIKAQ